MNFKQIDKSPKTFILVFKMGEELAKGLTKFAEEQNAISRELQGGRRPELCPPGLV